MERGEVYRLPQPPGGDPRRSRPVIVVSRLELLKTRHRTVICAPVFSVHDGLASQVLLGPESGLRDISSAHCDNLLSVPREQLRDYVGSLPAERLAALDRALAVAVGLTAPSSSTER